VITVSVVGIGCILFALFKRNTLDIYVFWGLIAMGVIIVAVRMESYIVTILRAKKVFFPESLGKVINAVLYIGLIYLVVKNFKLYGLYAVNTAVILCSILILIFLSKEHFRFSLKKEELKHLIKVGIPLVLLGFMFVNLTNIDRIVVVKMLGAEKLGYYSVSIMMGNIIYNVSNMASVVLYPRFQEIYGKNDDKREVYRVMQKIIKLIWFPLIILVLCGIVFLPYLVEILIPKYIAGITSMKILLCGIYFLSLSVFYRNYLVTINKQLVSLFMCIGAVIINLILNILFIKMGLSIEGVALATSISYFIYFLSLYIMVKVSVGNEI
jgi:O-antigen/teichoic acid export membrane protein